MPNDLTVPRERVAAIIERELPKYAGWTPRNAETKLSRSGSGTFNLSDEPNSGLENMAVEIARTTGRSVGGVARKLCAIRTGKAGFNRRGGRCPGNPTVSTVDWILTGLDLPHLWHTELADIYEQI